jgi:nucleotide-binding universal stress UspA family protein
MPPEIFGRVARGVALHGQCPVILIPKEYGYPTVEKLALAFKDVDDIRMIQGVVHRILSALRPEVKFIHVESPKDADSPITDEAFLEMALGPDYPDYSFDCSSIPAGPVVKRVLEYITQEQVGMLVLGGKRRSFWEGLFADSSLRPLVNHCEVPLLIIPLMAQG